MADNEPIACSLGADDLQRRLAAMAEIGADGLIGSSAEGGRHRLCFRDDAGMRERLERIVAAEAACCPFLELSLRADAGELVLSIAAPADAQEVADGLAGAFGASAREVGA